ncbi:polysaccharide pyruvyl transferase [Moorella thermoacetica]|uniref:Polysaccharide pyruvyl transferase n=1 Tax=Neomoorella thermoacetica TaxID=1525 RepID=A0A1J5N6C2_NEOTH|nr:polysaccharide pyruvyl transferase [Moorella thermoacetica]
MILFYTLPETNRKINSEGASRVVVLAGSFNGYLNFGDLLQLRGALRWHKQHWPGAVLCPLLHLRTVSDEKTLRELIEFFDTPHWLLYAHHSEEDANSRAKALGLEPLRVSDSLTPAILHVYGGGFFNGFWGRWMLDLIEAVLHTFPIGRYVISGQQVGAEFAPVLAEHCRRYRPDLVGCRDPLSVEILTHSGIEAFFSGDDAFEELLRYAETPATANVTSLLNPAFGLHLNLSGYVYSSPTQGDQAQISDRVISQQIECLLQLLVTRFGPSSIPIIVGSYLDPRHEVQDTWAAVKRTLLTRYLPQFIGLDIAGLLLQGRLEEAIPLLRSLKLFVATSYHTALFLKILGVPTYLLAFNHYYIQKQSGIQETTRSFEELLTIDPETLRKEQETVLLAHQKARQEWKELLERELSETPEKWGVILRGIAYLKEDEKRKSAKIKEQEQVIARLESENVAFRDQLESLQRQNSVMAEKLEEQKQIIARLESENVFLREQEVSKLRQDNAALSAKLEIIERSRSWKLVRKYWTMMDQPFWRLILSPIRKIALIAYRALNR